MTTKLIPCVCITHNISIVSTASNPRVAMIERFHAKPVTNGLGYNQIPNLRSRNQIHGKLILS